MNELVTTIDFLGDWKRTDYCGNLRKEDGGRKVVLLGWVQKRRDLGGLIFIEVRDRYGIVQVVFNPEANRVSHEKAQSLRSEYVVGVKGEVIEMMFCISGSVTAGSIVLGSFQRISSLG